MNIFYKLNIILTFAISLVACGGGTTNNNNQSLVNVVISSNSNVPILGKLFTLKANGIYQDESSKDITTQVNWKSSDATKATVDQSGNVKLLGIGQITFTATINDISATKTYTVIDKPRIEDIKLSGLNSSISEGQTSQISLSFTMTDGQNTTGDSSLVSFSSSDEKVLTVDANGLVNAVHYGTANITVSAKDSETSVVATVTIEPKLENISAVENKVYLDIGNPNGKTIIVTAHYSDNSSKDITGSVSWKYSTDNSEGSYLSQFDSVSISPTGTINANQTGNYYAKPNFDGLSLDTPIEIVIEYPLEILVLDDTNKIKITWPVKQDATEYQLFWTTDANLVINSDNITPEVIKNSNTFTLNNIDVTKTYRFKVAYIRNSEPLSALSPESKVQPLIGRWSQTAALTDVREDSSVIAVDNKLFVFGGKRINDQGQSAISDIYSYLDISKNSTWQTGLTMPAPRAAMAACHYGNSVYFFGGINADNTLSDQILKFNYKTEQWVATGIATLPTPISYASCNTVGNKIYIVAGQDSSGPSNAVLIFDPQAETSPPVATTSLISKRYKHASTVIGSSIYVVGGTDDTSNSPAVETLDTQNPDTWKALTQMNTPRYSLQLFAIGNKLYAFGGKDKDGHLLDSVEGFDTAINGDWQQLPKLPYANAAFGAAQYNDTIFLVGGDATSITDSGGLAGNMQFDTTLNTWTPSYPPGTTVTYFQSEIYNDQLFLIGGNSETDQNTNLMQAFDIPSGLWSNDPQATGPKSSQAPRTPAPLNEARVGIATVLVKNTIYAIGGNDISGTHIAISNVDVYDAVNNTWSSDSQLLHARKEACAVKASGNIFVFGGFSAQLNGDTDVIEKNVEMYNPINKTWIDTTTWKNPTAGAGCIVVNNTVYILGGIESQNGKLKVSNQVVAFNPDTLKFDTSPINLTVARYFPAVASLNGMIYVFGGYTSPVLGTTYLNSAEKLTPLSNDNPTLTNDIKSLPAIPDNFDYIRAQRYKNKILLIGSKANASKNLINNFIFTYE